MKDVIYEMTEKTKKEREIPRAHLVHILSAAVIVGILVFDGAIFNFSTQVLAEYIRWEVRVIFCAIIAVFALIFIIRSHNALFGSEEEGPSHLITTGIFDQVRHPMYLGILLIHLAFIVLTISLIALGAWIVIVFIYNRMANYEEEVLEEMFGEDYQEYKKRTSKWVPR